MLFLVGGYSFNNKAHSTIPLDQFNKTKRASPQKINSNHSICNYFPSNQKINKTLRLPVININTNHLSPPIKRRRDYNKMNNANDNNSIIKLHGSMINNSNNISKSSSKPRQILKQTKNELNINKDNEKHFQSIVHPTKNVIVFEEKSSTVELNKNLHQKNQSENINLKNSAIKENREEYLQMICAKSQAGKSDRTEIKINQDSFLFKQTVNGINDFNLFGVLDGHGKYGHCASKFVAQHIENCFESEFAITKLTNTYDIYKKLKEKNYIFIKAMFTSAEREMNKQNFDISFSGTTCVLIIQLGKRIISANVGDSRAILVTKSLELEYQIKQLSFDQKPDMKKEKSRIVKAGGRVDQYNEGGVKVGPSRVWAKKEMYPGLAMSRSIGDTIASNIGVIAEPDILEFELSNNTKECLIIASDGVWEFIDNKQVMNLSIPFIEKDDLNNVCQSLINESTSWWEKEDIVVDDITVVTAIFNNHIT